MNTANFIYYIIFKNFSLYFISDILSESLRTVFVSRTDGHTEVRGRATTDIIYYLYTSQKGKTVLNRG